MRPLVIVATAVAAACSTPPEPIGVWAVNGNRSVDELVSATGKTVVLIYDPSNCLSCGGPIGTRLDLGRSGRGAGVVLLLTRRPP